MIIGRNEQAILGTALKKTGVTSAKLSDRTGGENRCLHRQLWGDRPRAGAKRYLLPPGTLYLDLLRAELGLPDLAPAEEYGVAPFTADELIRQGASPAE